MSLNPRLAGFGSLYPELDQIREIIHELNLMGRTFPLVVGGQMVSPTPEFALRITRADFGVIGEGEIITHQLIQELDGERRFETICGLAIRRGNDVTVTPGGRFIENLSELPDLPYHLFPTSEWLQIGRWYTRHLPLQPHWRFNDRVINVHGGRGCPYACNFCYHHNRPRYRDIQGMMDEAERNLEHFDANMLYFSDDLVIAQPRRVAELIERIKRLPRPIEYSISTRFDILERIDDCLLAKLKQTGCRIMGLGIESGSDRMLKLIGKNTTAEKILQCLKRLKQHGILPSVSIMVGQDTETLEDVEKSRDLMVQSIREDPNIAYGFTIATPFPGSKMYQKIFDKQLLKDDQEFYNRYFYAKRIVCWNQVVNLSEMSENTVINLRDQLEETYIRERQRTYGQKAWEQIVYFANEQKKLAEAYESSSPEVQQQRQKEYEASQLQLEKSKLAAMGLAQ